MSNCMTRAYQCRTCLSKAFPAAVTLAEDKDSQRDLNLAQPRRRAVQ